jgi:hypothetical protein
VEGRGFSRAVEAPVLKGFSPWGLYVNITTDPQNIAERWETKEEQ